jgi:dTMP kinase
MSKKKQGKFIVIDGIDSSGKATQAEIMKKYLEHAGYKVKIISFPQYDKKSAGLVENYLEGKYGDLDEVNPYQASILYAVDRFDAKIHIEELLEKGYIVIANRYTTANLAHQGSKLNTALHRQTFYEWAKNLEYKILNIPQPDAIFFLNVKAEIAERLLTTRVREDWENKFNDIHEKNFYYQKATENAYLEISRIYPEIKNIECYENAVMLSVDEVARRLWKEISNFLNIKKEYPLPGYYFHTEKTNYSPAEKNTIKFIPRNDLYTEPKLNIDKKSYILFAADYHTLRPGESEFISAGLAIDLAEDKFAWVVDTNQRPQQIINPGMHNEILIEIINREHDDVHISPQQIIGYLYIFKNK